MSIISAGTSVGTSLVSTGDTTGNLVFKTGPSATTALTLSGTDQSATFAGAVSFSSNAFALGSASAPSITFTGDTNTGIFSPGADTIAFTEGGTESMRIDASGNVGIANSSPTVKLDVSGQARFSSGATASAAILTSTNAGGTALNIQNSGTVNSLLGGYNAIVGSGNATDVMLSATQGVLAFGTGASSTERVRIGSAGQIGIGGANYGTSGQVLTSGGSGAAPSWTTISSTPTTAQVLSATAGLTAGAVGTYLMGRQDSGTGDISFGGTVSGSNLKAAGQAQIGAGAWDGSTTQSGTWRCLGVTYSTSAGTQYTTLWIRTA
jgi:hypothetical protein